MRKILLIALLVFNVHASCLDEQVERIADKYKIDMKVKSLKGWVRVLSNPQRMTDMGISMSEKDKAIMIACLTDNIKNSRVGVLR